MKLRNLVIAAVAAVSTILPAQARVDPDTDTMLATINSNGIAVTFNTKDCKVHRIHGAYITVGHGGGQRRELVLCTSGEFDAQEHETARHEMMHVLQHCVNTQRGTSRNTPIASLELLRDAVNTHVPESTVAFVKENYPQEKWLIEFEAQLAQRIFSAQDLIDLWNSYNCASVF